MPPNNMSMSSSNFSAIALLMFVSGLGIPILATLNAGLGQQIASPVAASAILFGVGALLSGALLLITGLPDRSAFTGARWYSYAAAVFMLFYLLAITWSAPRIGLGNAVFFVLLGQLVAAAAIDHFGILGAIKTGITGRRLLGLCVMALGVYLARKTR